MKLGSTSQCWPCAIRYLSFARYSWRIINDTTQKQKKRKGIKRGQHEPVGYKQEDRHPINEIKRRKTRCCSLSSRIKIEIKASGATGRNSNAIFIES